MSEELHFVIASIAGWQLMWSLCWVLEPTFVALVTASSLPVPADRHVSVLLVLLPLVILCGVTAGPTWCSITELCFGDGKLFKGKSTHDFKRTL
jgi:hypothetical protein